MANTLAQAWDTLLAAGALDDPTMTYRPAVASVLAPDSAVMLAPTVTTARVAADKSADKNLGPADPVDGLRSSTIDGLGDRYTVVSPLGSGGMGEVFLARQAVLERDVAVKVLRSNDADALRQFRSESLVTGLLDHPGIVPVHDAGEDFLVMKCIRGQTLADSMRAKPRDVQSHVDILLRVCEAMAFAHSRGIIHRDLKPANIMAGDFGEVMVLDWGLALSVDADRPDSQRDIPCLSDKEWLIAGTPAYMAPEQALGDADAMGLATDVFLLGSILYCCLTGQPPFMASTSRESLQRCIAMELRPAEQLNEAAPADLVAIQRQAMQADPAKRPTVSEFAAALRDWQRQAGAEAAAQDALVKADTALQAGDAAGTIQGAYAAYSDALAQAERGAAVGTTARPAAALLQRIRRGYAERALATGDLVLARTIVGSHAGPAFDGLRSSVDEAEKRRHRTERRLRGLRRSLLIAAVAVISLVMVFAWYRDVQARRESSLRAAAEHRVGDIRQLVQRILFDLDDDLVAVPRSAAIRLKLVETVRTYLDRLRREAPGDAELKRELLEAECRLAQILGHPDHDHLDRPLDARDAYERALVLAEELQDDDQADRCRLGLIAVLHAADELTAAKQVLQTMHDRTDRPVALVIEAYLAEAQVLFSSDAGPHAMALAFKAMAIAAEWADRVRTADEGIQCQDAYWRAERLMASIAARCGDRFAVFARLRDSLHEIERRLAIDSDDVRLSNHRDAHRHVLIQLIARGAAEDELGELLQAAQSRDMSLLRLQPTHRLARERLQWLFSSMPADTTRLGGWRHMVNELVLAYPGEQLFNKWHCILLTRSIGRVRSIDMDKAVTSWTAYMKRWPDDADARLQTIDALLKPLRQDRSAPKPDNERLLLAKKLLQALNQDDSAVMLRRSRLAFCYAKGSLNTEFVQAFLEGLALLQARTDAYPDDHQVWLDLASAILHEINVSFARHRGRYQDDWVELGGPAFAELLALARTAMLRAHAAWPTDPQVSQLRGLLLGKELQYSTLTKTQRIARLQERMQVHRELLDIGSRTEISDRKKSSIDHLQIAKLLLEQNREEEAITHVAEFIRYGFYSGAWMYPEHMPLFSMAERLATVAIRSARDRGDDVALEQWRYWRICYAQYQCRAFYRHKTHRPHQRRLPAIVDEYISSLPGPLSAEALYIRVSKVRWLVDNGLEDGHQKEALKARLYAARKRWDSAAKGMERVLSMPGIPPVDQRRYQRLLERYRESEKLMPGKMPGE